MKKRSFKLSERLSSFRYAFAGIKELFASEPNTRIHLVLTVAAVGLALGLKISWLEWAFLILAIAAVWAAEAFNTAIETLVDLVSPQTSSLAARAKDLSAAAVLAASIGALGAGLGIFGPRLFSLFHPA